MFKMLIFNWQIFKTSITSMHSSFKKNQIDSQKEYRYKSTSENLFGLLWGLGLIYFLFIMTNKILGMSIQES